MGAEGRGAKTAVALGALSALGALACARTQPVDAGGGAALLRNLLAAPGIDVLAPSGPIEERCALIAASRTGPASPPLHVVTKPGECRPEHARVVIATSSDPAVQRLCAVLGIACAPPASFGYARQSFDRPDDTLIATFQDPDRPGLPVTLFLGNDAARMVFDVEAPLWGWKPNVRILRGGEPVLEAPLTPAGVLIEERADRSAARRMALHRAYVPVPAHWAGFSGVCAPDLDPSRARAYFDAAAASASRAVAWATPGEGATPLEVVLHAHVEDCADWTGCCELGTWNEHTRIAHVLLSEGAVDDGGAVLVRGLLERALGAPVEEWLAQGAAVEAAQSYLGRELVPWLGWIARAELVLPVRTLVDPRADELYSPHVLGPLRAALVRHVLDTRGAGYLRQLWRGTQRLELDAALESAFQLRLQSLGFSAEAGHVAELARRRARANPAFVGLTLSEPAAARGDGFGTRAAAQSLEDARAAGSRGLALTSLLAAEHDPAARAGPGSGARYGAREGDVALLATLGLARARGLRAVLLPHLLSADGGTWSGTWLRNGEADWAAFYADYQRFAAHYAALAELSGCDVLSLGGGLTETTRFTVEGRRGQAEELGWKQAGWTRVIGAARGLFRGTLTFAAGSAEELEKIEFWEQLDAVALEPRALPRSQRGRPASASQAAFEQELAATWAAGLRVARAQKKPLYVVAASFPAGPAPDAPRVGPGSAVDDLRTRAFAELCELARADAHGVAAVLIGRWSTAEGDEGLSPRDHLLAGPRAHELARETLARLGPALEQR